LPLAAPRAGRMLHLMANAVLVGADLSEPSDEAVRQAHDWAKRRGARFLVCHVLPRALGTDLLLHDRVDPSLFEAQVADRLRAHVARLTGRPVEEIEILLEEGDAEENLLRFADEREVDLIVVGSHSQAGLGRIFLGDVAESVVRNARRPVLVARPSPSTRRILVGSDFSRPARRALELAVEEARSIGGQITILTSIEQEMRTVLMMAEFGSAGQFVEGEERDDRAKARRQLAALVADMGVDAEIIVTEENPAADLVRIASQIEAQLVVVGALGGERLPVATKVTRHAPSSVLVVREIAR
jgi:nucleotide-binding universal stress UspA family protein